MKYTYNLIILLIIASSAMKAMDNNHNPSCYKTYSREYIRAQLRDFDYLKKNPEFIHSYTEIRLLALLCHEFTEQDIVTKTQKMGPYQVATDGIPFSNDRKECQSSDKIIEIKKKDGCFPASCAKLLDLIYQAREQVTKKTIRS